MNHFCTLFDSNYLSRGLAMYRSLVATGEEFTLYVVCFDDLAFRTLGKMKLPGVVTVSLAEFETEELKRVKPERSRAEYCWTCTPHVIRHVLDTFRLPAVTYLDADIFFYERPSLLLEEMERAGGSVLITGHNYSGQYAQLLVAGIYCVQFLCIKADQRGMEVLQWWQDRCLKRFAGVHVLEHPGGGVAPWNVQRFRVAMLDGKPHVTEKGNARVFEVVFYHFHHLRFYTNGYLELGNYELSREVKRLLYRPYLEKLDACKRDVARFDPSFDPHGRVPPASGFVKALGRIQRRLKGNYLPIDKYRSL